MSAKTVVLVFAATAVAGLIMVPARAPKVQGQFPQPTQQYLNSTSTPTTSPKITPKKAIDPKAELRARAKARGLSDARIKQMEAVIKCESGWKPNAIGDKGRSIGLVQIYLPAHPHITKAQALDPVFAINFIIDEFINGNSWKWTCYKTLFT